MRWALVAVAWLLLGIGQPIARGQEESVPQIVGVRVGIAGQYKAGLWTPVQVLLHGGREPWSGQVSIIAPDGDGVPCRFSTPANEPCRVGAGESKSVELYARFGRAEPALTVQLRRSDSDAVQAEHVFRAGDSDSQSVFHRALRSTDGLIVVVGADPAWVERNLVGLRQLAGGRTVPAHVTDATQLPEQWVGYEGADVVILATRDLAAYAGLRPSSPQVVALEQWVRMGGTMLLCAGRNAESVIGASGLLTRFAPGRLARTILLPESSASAIEAYCGSSSPIPRQGSGRQLGLRVPQLADVQGTVEARDGNLPLVVRRTLGFGDIVFTAFDLDGLPLFDPDVVAGRPDRGWPDLGLLVGKLLDVEESAGEGSRPSGAVLHYGFDDMAGQLRSALDQFQGVPFIPFWIVVALVASYLALIGPGDYFFLRRIVGRMTATWITFPLVVTVFCAGAYFLAHRLKGDRVRVNQVDLVDVDLPSGQVRGTSWATVFSPSAQRSGLSFEPQPLSRQTGREKTGASSRQSADVDSGGPSNADVKTCWLGLPGESFGGMAPKTAAATIWKETYDCSPRLDSLAGVPMPTWSTKSFTARWTATTDVRPEAHIVEQDRIPVGTITNTLSFPLSECLLCYSRWAYRLGDLAPGESAQVGATSERRDLTTLLTGRRLLFEEGVQRATPYDRGSGDVTYIVRAMMFFKAAGGHRYTGLVNRHQGFVDLSDLLKTDRAILMAIGPTADPRSPHHGARLVYGGDPAAGPQDRHTTIYRFVMRVGKER